MRRIERFIEKNLDASYGGTLEQQDDVAALASQTLQADGELGDFLSGERKLGDHEHHSPKVLAKRVIQGIEDIVAERKKLG